MMKENMGKNRETMKNVMTTGRDTKCQCKNVNTQSTNTDPFFPINTFNKSKS